MQLAAAIRRKNAWRAALLLVVLPGCQPDLVVGTWQCHASDGDEGVTATTEPVSSPWSTSFETAFCDFGFPGGYCYADARASYETVTWPVHSGEYAAAFSLTTDAAFNGLQTRCVRQGALPAAAYYSAYFFIPVAPSAANNWNLMHFRGGDTAVGHGLWDVSLAMRPDGQFQVFVFDFLRMMTRLTASVPAVPVGDWFQLEVYLERATGATGEFALYQDGELALRLENVVTDDTTYGQWYVGNLAVSLTPPETVLFVDDVAIRTSP